MSVRREGSEVKPLLGPLAHIANRSLARTVLALAFYLMPVQNALAQASHFCTTSERCQPFTPLTLGNDGNFYRTTTNGETGKDGTIFKITPAPAK